ncbi:hypothetical protein HYH03_014728 [Edaphochlamys debaryana]|uniref:Uncharacterized protein n=1 Tax=Edaphochlamys debaryana TaxID=47281 RepID=A0A835XNA8_9CHLO|nr:hypothetical protein HYH03_014728 [Edaphochlamys debaryana]|eukprot:KAG2486674.1 hypothetical protein HYH03_014728 [Edaphochlamys debaryana]
MCQDAAQLVLPYNPYGGPVEQFVDVYGIPAKGAAMPPDADRPTMWTWDVDFYDVRRRFPVTLYALRVPTPRGCPPPSPPRPQPPPGPPLPLSPPSPPTSCGQAETGAVNADAENAELLNDLSADEIVAAGTISLDAAAQEAASTPIVGGPSADQVLVLYVSEPMQASAVRMHLTHPRYAVLEVTLVRWPAPRPNTAGWDAAAGRPVSSSSLTSLQLPQPTGTLGVPCGCGCGWWLNLTVPYAASGLPVQPLASGTPPSPASVAIGAVVLRLRPFNAPSRTVAPVIVDGLLIDGRVLYPRVPELYNAYRQPRP